MSDKVNYKFLTDTGLAQYHALQTQFADGRYATRITLELNDETKQYEIVSYAKDKTELDRTELPDLTVNVTYDELVELRDSNKLIPGAHYRIIDYETIVNPTYGQIGGSTYYNGGGASKETSLSKGGELLPWIEEQSDQKETESGVVTIPLLKSAGHIFDIVVDATSTNTIDNRAHAVRSEREPMSGLRFVCDTPYTVSYLIYNAKQYSPRYENVTMQITADGVTYFTLFDGCGLYYDFTDYSFIRPHTVRVWCANIKDIEDISTITDRALYDKARALYLKCMDIKDSNGFVYFNDLTWINEEEHIVNLVSDPIHDIGHVEIVQEYINIPVPMSCDSEDNVWYGYSDDASHVIMGNEKQSAFEIVLHAIAEKEGKSYDTIVEMYDDDELYIDSETYFVVPDEYFNKNITNNHVYFAVYYHFYDEDDEHVNVPITAFANPDDVYVVPMMYFDGIDLSDWQLEYTLDNDKVWYLADKTQKLVKDNVIIRPDEKEKEYKLVEKRKEAPANAPAKQPIRGDDAVLNDTDETDEIEYGIYKFTQYVDESKTAASALSLKKQQTRDDGNDTIYVTKELGTEREIFYYNIEDLLNGSNPDGDVLEHVEEEVTYPASKGGIVRMVVNGNEAPYDIVNLMVYDEEEDEYYYTFNNNFEAEMDPVFADYCRDNKIVMHEGTLLPVYVMIDRNNSSTTRQGYTIAGCTINCWNDMQKSYICIEKHTAEVVFNEMRYIDYLKSASVMADNNCWYDFTKLDSCTSVTIDNVSDLNEFKVTFRADDSFTISLPSGARYIGSLDVEVDKKYQIVFSGGIYYIGEIKQTN